MYHFKNFLKIFSLSLRCDYELGSQSNNMRKYFFQETCDEYSFL